MIGKLLGRTLGRVFGRVTGERPQIPDELWQATLAGLPFLDALDEFVIPRSVEDEFGVVHEYDEIASGEAWAGGPLLISWSDAQMAGAGYNVVIHEFAHKLDMCNGEADGIPPLPRTISRTQWEETLFDAWEDFCAEVDAAEEACAAAGAPEDAADDFCLPSGLDPYGAESPAEFFAVMSEAFFETPTLLQARFPELYALLTAFYRQDPATRKHA